MTDFDIALRIRTESSYQLSIDSSRSSIFCSGESACLDDQDISLIRKFRQICAGQITCSTNLRIQDDQSSFIDTRQQYVIQTQKKGGFNAEIDNMLMFRQYNYKKTQERLSLPINCLQQLNSQANELDKKRKNLSSSAPSSQYPYLNLKNKSIDKNQNYTIPLSIQKLLTSYRRSPNLANQNDLLNAAYGSMFGFIIGDTIGSHLIHKSQNIEQSISKALQMKGGGIFNLAPGQGTDQTEIMLALSNGLIKCNQNRNSSIQSSSLLQKYDLNQIAKNYFQWFESKPFDYPTLIAISFSQIRKQKLKNNGILGCTLKLGDILEKGSYKNHNHQSNIGLIRMIPLTLWSLALNDQQFYSLIRKQMKFFTPNQYVIQVCFLYGKMLRLILLNNDHQYAIHQTSKWIYSKGSAKLKSLWSMFLSNKQFQLNGQNMNLIQISFLFMLHEINKNRKKINFIDSLIKILFKGYNTDTNCAIVMGMVGAIIGYNEIPNYFKTVVIDCNVQKSVLRQRGRQYCPSKIVDIVPKLLGSMIKREQ